MAQTLILGELSDSPPPHRMWLGYSVHDGLRYVPSMGLPLGSGRAGRG